MALVDSELRRRQRWVKVDNFFYEDTIGNKWHTFDCMYDVGNWLDQQGEEYAKILGPYHRAVYKVNEKLLPFLYIKFPPIR